MESERMGAAASLDAIAAAKRNAVETSRLSAGVVLWSAVATSIYCGVFVLLYSDPTSPRSSVGVMLAVPVLLAVTGLMSGLMERLGMRFRPHASQMVVALVLIGGFFVVPGVMGVFGSGYPWWFALLAVPITFIFLTARTLVLLIRSPRPKPTAAADGTPAPLTRDARFVTVGLAVLLGMMAASVPWEILPLFGVMLANMALIVPLLARASPWGLANVGAEWGRMHWVAFAISAGILLAIIVGGHPDREIPPLVAVSGGVVIIGVMTSAALLAKGRR